MKDDFGRLEATIACRREGKFIKITERQMQGGFRAFLKECEIIMAANEENRPKKHIYELWKIKRILDSENKWLVWNNYQLTDDRWQENTINPNIPLRSWAIAGFSCSL